MARRSVEGTLFSALKELGRVFGEDRVMNTAGNLLQGAAQTKATVDGNMAALLGLAGLPSRADIDALRRQLDVVQATLANLSRKIDRLLEDAAGPEKESHRPASTRRKRARSRSRADTSSA